VKPTGKAWVASFEGLARRKDQEAVMVLSNVGGLREGMSMLKLGLEVFGLNLLTAGLAAAGAELGIWAAGMEGGGVGLATGLVLGLVGHAAGAGRIADKGSRD
jgi:hypothetical protein